MVELIMKKNASHIRNVLLLTMILFFIFICISRGISSMKKWRTYSTPHLHSLNDLWFNGETGVVAGYYQALDDLLSLSLYESLAKEEAIILYKQDFKSCWSKVYSGQGDILQFSYNAKEKFLYALGREYFPDGKWRAFLLLSKDFGKNWVELPKPPEKTEGLSFVGDMVGYTWSIDQVYHSTDEAKTWVPCEKIEFKLEVNGPKPLSGKNNKFWYTKESNLYSILPDGRVQKEKMPPDFTPEVLASDPHDDLWLLGKSVFDQKLILLKRTDFGEFELVSSLPYFLPGQLHVGFKIIVITGTNLKNIPPTERVMVRSFDDGKLWDSVHKLPDGTKAFFEDDKAIWLLGTMDRLHRLVN